MLQIERDRDNKVLRKISEPINEIDIELLDLIKSMTEKLNLIGYLGLSACQVGINKRMFIMVYDIRNNENINIHIPKKYMQVKTCINPKIIESIGKCEYIESCVSLPKESYNKIRAKEIKISYYNKNGKKIIESLRGVNARIFLHEYDHLEGRLICDT